MNVWKTIKLFISSTFVDLELERDHLIEEFADIKKELVARQLSFITYDLRWRQKHEKESIVKWCIEMVDRCEYFVGILGSRYGWRPPLDAEGKPNSKNISVTEMEILHALENIEREKRFFCFLEKENDTGEDATSLKQLKKKLIDNGEDILEFTDTNQMLSSISAKVKEKIDLHYPPQQKVDITNYTIEQITTEFIYEKVLGFVGRTKILRDIHNFALGNDNKNYLIVHAMAGSGKSALIAKFCEEWQEKQNSHLLRYFVAVSGSIRDLILSMLKQMREINILKDDIKEEPFEMRAQMRNILENTKEKIVFLIDAVDEMEESAKDFNWLPRNLPSNIRVIISTRPVASFEALQKYPQTQLLSLPPMDHHEIQKIIDDYNSKYDINISSQDRQLLQERASGNPLYLKVALEEIVSTGVGIGQLATSIDRLFEQVLERLHLKYKTSLVYDYLGFIAASKTGLTENELRELVAEYHDSSEVSDDLILIITKSLSHFIVQRAGVMQFFHAEFERSLKQRFGRGRMRKYHQGLATYFKKCGYSYLRSLNEICFQMQWAEMYPELLSLLTNLEFLQAKVVANMVDDLAYDFELALHHPLIPIPASTKSNCGGVTTTTSTLYLLWRALTVDLRFIRKHPQYFFQCMWNRCYWYDAVNTKNYYEYQENEFLPWKKNIQISTLVQKWREQQKDHTWLEAVSPTEPHLDSRLRKNFSAHQREVMSVALHREKERIVSVSRDRKVYVWHMETGECLAEMADHNEHIYSVAFAPSGHRFATGDVEGLLLVWDSNNMECIQILEGHHGAITSIKFDEKRDQIISVAEDATIMFWDVIAGKKLDVLDGFQEAFVAIAVSESCDFLACASKDGNVCIFNLDTKKLVHVFKGHERIVTDVAFSTDEQYVASSSKDNSIRIWSMKNKTCVSHIAQHYASVNSVRFIPHTHVIVSGGEDNSLFVTDIHTKNILIGWQKHNWNIYCLEVSDDLTIVCGAKDGSVTLWDIKDYKNLAKEGQEQAIQLKGHKKNVNAIAVSVKNQCVVSVAEDKFIKLWSFVKNENIKSYYTDDIEMQCMDISSDCTKVVTGSNNGVVALFNLQTGDVIHKMKGHKGKVSRIFFCKNDHYIMSLGYFDNTVRLWDMLSGECVQIFSGHERWIENIVINSDETLLASGSRDKTMKIWDINTGQCLKTMHGHEIGVTSVAFSYDSKMVASASSHQGVIRIWQTKTGSCLSIFSPPHNDIIEEMAFSPDSKEITCVYKSNKSAIWDIENNKLIQVLEGRIHLKDYYDSATNKYSIMQNWQTLIIDKQQKKQIAAFPEAIFQLQIIGDEYISGVCKSNSRGVIILRQVTN